jgi:hypothetical protein
MRTISATSLAEIERPAEKHRQIKTFTAYSMALGTVPTIPKNLSEQKLSIAERQVKDQRSEEIHRSKQPLYPETVKKRLAEPRPPGHAEPQTKMRQIPLKWCIYAQPMLPSAPIVP